MPTFFPKKRGRRFFLNLMIISMAYLLLIVSPAVCQNAPQHPLLDSLHYYLKDHRAEPIHQFATQLLNESENDSPLACEAYKFLGISYFIQSEYDSAVFYYKQSQAIAEALNDSLNIAKARINLATVYNRQGDFQLARSTALDACRIFEQLKDQSGLARGQNLMGIFHFYRKDYESALDYFEQYHELAVAARDTGEIISSLNNMSSAYHELKRFEQERTLLKKVLTFYENQNLIVRAGSSYENLGSMYIDADSLVQAKRYFEKALNAYQLNDDRLAIARLYINLGRLETLQHKYTKAENYLDKAIELTTNGGFLVLQQEALEKKKILYLAQKKYEEAFYALSDFVEVKDSLLNEKNQESINELQVQYDTEKKERQIAQQALEIAQIDYENQQKSFYIFILLGSIVIVLLFGLALFYRMKNKQQKRLAEERMLQKQHQMKVVFESQEGERKRFARDLHDGFGQLITALKINVQQLTEQNDDRQTILERSISILNDMHSQIRGIAHNLMPESLLEEGLEGAVREYAVSISERTSTQIEVNVFDLNKKLDQGIEIGTYRVIQEWINNVLKHAQANLLTIQLTGHDDEINILIEDDGEGFDTSKLEQGKGWGWKNIQTRIEAINGRLTVDSTPGIQGTSLILDIPFK